MTLHDIFVREFSVAFQDLTSGHAPEHVAGLGAYSDSDASSVILMAHSLQDQRQQLEDYPAYPADAIWAVTDWDLRYSSQESLRGPQGAVNAAVDRATAEIGDVQAVRAVVWGSAVDALTTLHQQGFFDQWPESVRGFWVLDGSAGDQRLYDWQTRFNAAERLDLLPTFLGTDQAIHSEEAE